jgi:alkanesulfonate monooxygenase SsuD/methylene tetrahydromethanopterin reductase-like flavin-dependent oxidoreductase (luciferase family)
MTLHIGVNLNNREALIAPNYDARGLLALAQQAEELGLDSVWVGDSLLARPRYEPLALLGALAQRTSAIRLGTACLVTTLRHPVQLAHAWSTIDVLSGGRTVLGACAGNLAEEGVKKEFALMGINPQRRMRVFEEGLKIFRALTTEGRVTFVGDHFELDDVAFHTGTEPEPLLPDQRPPPIWVVANPSIGAPGERRSSKAAARVAGLGDGWMTCCRASHPEEVENFLAELATLRNLDGFDVAYQVTITLGETKQEALAEQRRYIDAYYPDFRDAVALADWGPAGAPDEVADWIDRFSRAGVTTFICRFASLDQFGQLELFGEHVLPRCAAAQE